MDIKMLLFISLRIEGFHFYFPMFVLTPEIKMGWGIGNLHSRDTNLKFSNTIDKINSRIVSFSLTVE